MLKHLRPIPLIIGIIIGIIVVFCIKPTKNIVHKYPTPETADRLVYKDKNGVCYKYAVKNADCDKNESRLKDFPLIK
jgi:hypothetical protein